MRLGLVAIVKNEQANIRACLESAIAAGVTVATIVDTGSTDVTRAIVRDACKDIDLHLYRRKFRGFGPTRSEAFRLARGTADWLLALDADMTVEWMRTSPPWASTGWPAKDYGWAWFPNPEFDCYLLDMGGEGFSNRLPLLLRGDLPWRSIGMVHEYTALPDRAYRAGELSQYLGRDDVRITQPGVAAWSPDKARWHLTLLEQDPSDRAKFYRAKTLDELGDPAAREAWEGVGVTAEERYYAMWRRALLAPDWPTRQVELQAAWEYRPVRLEALYDLVDGLNQHGAHHAAWALASVTVPPCGDSLFVHRFVWDYGLLFQRQIAAWWVQAPEFQAITDRLLSLNLPSHIRQAVERNASLRAA